MERRTRKLEKLNRDKLGSLRKNIGGRPLKATKDRAGVVGGKSTNRQGVADPRKREFTAPEALKLIAEVESKYAIRFPEGSEKPQRPNVNKFYHEMAFERKRCNGRYDGKETERIVNKKGIEVASRVLAAGKRHRE